MRTPDATQHNAGGEQMPAARPLSES